MLYRRAAKSSLATALWLTVALAGGPSRADPSASAPATAEDAAGVAAFDHGDFERARRLFEVALAKRGRTETLLNLALAEMNAKKLIDARNHFKQYLARPDADPKRDLGVTRMIVRIESRLVELSVQAPPGAQIRIDGSAARILSAEERAGAALYVEPGRHQVTLIVGAKEVDVSVAGAAGERIVLGEGPAAAAPPKTAAPAATPKTRAAS